MSRVSLKLGLAVIIEKTCFDILMSFSVASEVFSSCTLKTESKLLRVIVTLLSCLDISSQGLGMSGYPVYDQNLQYYLPYL